MEKFIPYEKLSKKEKRKINAAKRNTWGNLNPVTRKPQNSKHITETNPGIGCVMDTKPIPGLSFWALLRYNI